MSLKVAIQMDPLERINLSGDSTYALAIEAQARGHALYHYLPRDLTLLGDHLTATARPFTVAPRGSAKPFEIGPVTTLDLGTMDVILMRQDPPFDMAYITATHLLEHVAKKALVVNDPASVRNAPEKLFATHFPKLMPETLITSDPNAVREFRAKHGDIILKPLFGNGGAGVFRLMPQDENLNALLEMFTVLYREPIMAQRYLPEIRQGDKRIILVDGEPVGGVLRVPQAGEARANLHVGGTAKKVVLSKRDREICAAIGPTLSKMGLVFVGIDVIGDYLTEINVTSPTGIQEIDRLDGVNLAAKVWDAIEKRHKARGA